MLCLIDTDINVVYLLGLFIYSIQVTGVHSDKSVFISFIYISETTLYLNVSLHSKLLHSTDDPCAFWQKPCSGQLGKNQQQRAKPQQRSFETD